MNLFTWFLPRQGRLCWCPPHVWGLGCSTGSFPLRGPPRRPWGDVPPLRWEWGTREGWNNSWDTEGLGWTSWKLENLKLIGCNPHCVHNIDYIEIRREFSLSRTGLIFLSGFFWENHEWLVASYIFLHAPTFCTFELLNPLGNILVLSGVSRWERRGLF